MCHEWMAPGFVWRRGYWVMFYKEGRPIVAEVIGPPSQITVTGHTEVLTMEGIVRASEILSLRK